MRGLLMVLCALVTAAASLAGGCAVLFSGLAAGMAPRDETAGMLLIAIAAPILAVSAAVTAINLWLIIALARGRAPRRTIWFLLLGGVDLLLAGLLLALLAFAPQGPEDGVAWLVIPLAAALAVKGMLTLFLPASPPPG